MRKITLTIEEAIQIHKEEKGWIRNQGLSEDALTRIKAIEFFGDSLANISPMLCIFAEANKLLASEYIKSVKENVVVVRKVDCVRYILNNWEDYLDCGELDATLIAEDCASTFEHDEWLDDVDHWVWEVWQDVEDVLQKEGKL